MKEILWTAWPWIGAAGGVVIIILMFCTNKMRRDNDVSRWKDPVWLAWAMAAAYLFHVVEEYGLHFHNGQYDLIQNFIDTGVSDMFGGITNAFFPYINIMLTWVALPIAAGIARKHPVIGLSGSGFLLINGFVHLGSLIRSGGDLAGNGGVVTGLLIFLPLFIWIVIVCRREHLLPPRGLGIAIVSGIIGHIGLFTIYIANKLIGSTFVFFYVPVVAFIPIIVSAVLCKSLHVDDWSYAEERNVKS